MHIYDYHYDVSNTKVGLPDSLYKPKPKRKNLPKKLSYIFQKIFLLYSRIDTCKNAKMHKYD